MHGSERYNEMKIGFIQVYNEINWIGYAIDQAMNFCDELIVCEGSQFIAFPDIPKRSDDDTLDIVADKTKQYPGRIKIINTIRKHNNYRFNQCANFNLGLDYCNMGDYFIHLDADEFFTDEWIAETNEIMREGKADYIKALGYGFAFGFRWRIDFGEIQPRAVIVKKTEGLYFKPTHHYVNPGKNMITIPRIGHYHYYWLKPRGRMRMRMRTSSMYPNMLKWFDTNWDNFKLEDSKEYPCYIGNFILHKYEDRHPSILDDHPWKDVDDIRKL